MCISGFLHRPTEPRSPIGQRVFRRLPGPVRRPLEDGSLRALCHRACAVPPLCLRRPRAPPARGGRVQAGGALPNSQGVPPLPGLRLLLRQRVLPEGPDAGKEEERRSKRHLRKGETKVLEWSGTSSKSKSNGRSNSSSSNNSSSISINNNNDRILINNNKYSSSRNNKCNRKKVATAYSMKIELG